MGAALDGGAAAAFALGSGFAGDDAKAAVGPLVSFGSLGLVGEVNDFFTDSWLASSFNSSRYSPKRHQSHAKVRL